MHNIVIFITFYKILLSKFDRLLGGLTGVILRATGVGAEILIFEGN